MSYSIWTEKVWRDNWQREITPKILMPELWILCIALDLLKFYPHMKFHFNSISWTWVIAFGHKKCVTGQKVWRDKKSDVRTDRRTDWQTDGRTDRQTDDGEVIPKCHLCLQKQCRPSSYWSCKSPHIRVCTVCNIEIYIISIKGLYFFNFYSINTLLSHLQRSWSALTQCNKLQECQVRS